MNEENNLNNVNNETPVVPEQPVVDETPQVPAQPVAPVEPTGFPNTVNTPIVEQPKQKSSNGLLIVFIALIILCGGAYLCYKFILPKVTNTNNGETTTTTATANPKLLNIKTMEDYVNIVKEANWDNNNYGILSLDGSFYDLDFNVKNRCANGGGLIEYTVKNSKVSFTCVKDEEVDEDWGEDEWIADITVNGKYKYVESTFTTSQSTENFTNGKYYLGLTFADSYGGVTFSLETEDNLPVAGGKFEYNLFLIRDELTDAPMITKDNILYYVVADKADDGQGTMCRVKYIDLDKEVPAVEDMNVTSKCIYTE